jgi:hypothetical protein
MRGINMKLNLIELRSEKKWELIISTFIKDPSLFTSNVEYNILAESYYEKGNNEKSKIFVNKSLVISGNNNWTRTIKFNNDSKLEGIEYALYELYSYLLESKFSSESLMRTFVDKSMEFGEFNRSQEVNLNREVIKEGKNNPFCIAIQCFNKVDVLEDVFKKLLNCTHSGNFEVVLLQDMYLESDEEQYSEGWKNVRELLSTYHSSLTSKFGTVTTIYNVTNLGTAPSCRKLLNYVSKVYEGFIFIEDDCLLSRDALLITEEFINNHIDEDNYWFATCESINFDAKEHEMTLEEINTNLVNMHDLDSWKNLYGEFKFVPSTCFITKCSIWNKVSNIRAFIRGPESLSKYMLKVDKKTIFPLIPRASDIGMIHELGYSVKHLTLAGVKEFKNTYYLPDFNHDQIKMRLAEKTLVNKVYATSTKNILSTKNKV